jgi:hypothetical protein
MMQVVMMGKCTGRRDASLKGMKPPTLFPPLLILRIRLNGRSTEVSIALPHLVKFNPSSVGVAKICGSRSQGEADRLD